MKKLSWKARILIGTIHLLMAVYFLRKIYLEETTDTFWGLIAVFVGILWFFLLISFIVKERQKSEEKK
ncbi:MAG: hypothetical protein KI791_09895 [Cyclobacteriaceae bacterium]|nr:hypothetical protein [Cyclobacteriaceae bacterium SS2]